MSQHYFLYIDILGFSEMVHNRPGKIWDLYKTIDDLNVHRHDAFKTIVFSDTMLVYNIEESRTAQDHQYFVMFACEFAQNLLYETIGKDIYFRGVLRYGEFEHRKLQNREAFYGPVLVESYRSEKVIKSTGLFIDSYCNRYNQFFRTAKYNKDYSFVFLNQSLERLHETTHGNVPLLPLPPILLEGVDPWHLSKDLRMLRDIHQGRKHRKDDVREKFENTWRFFDKRYPKLLATLQAGNFERKVVSPISAWTALGIRKAERTDVEAQFEELFLEAHEVAHETAQKHEPIAMSAKYESEGKTKQDIIEEGKCGFAWIVIRPGNSAFARWLKEKKGGRKSYPRGVYISVTDYGQSYERKKKYAERFVEMLRKAGIDAFAESTLD